MTELQLGGANARRRGEDSLRDGEIVVVSPRGLARETAFLVDALPRHDPGSALFGLDTEATAAMAGRLLWAGTSIDWFHMDAYVAAKAARVVADNALPGISTGTSPDVPSGPYDLVALPFPSNSDHQLMWDVLEGAHDALRVGGRLVASTDGKPDALREAVKKVFRNVTIAAIGRRGGAAFYGIRKRESSALRDRSCVVRAVIRPADGSSETSLDVETRPGTFAYRAIDAGTRALAEQWTPMEERSVLDLGAGCGALGLYAALRLPEARVTLVDSNVRAIGCARRSADAAGVGARAVTLVRADFEDLPRPEGGYDTVLANPPYFGDFRIARSFVDAAHAALRTGGRVLLVAKAGTAGRALEVIVDEIFGDALTIERNGYDVVCASRR